MSKLKKDHKLNKQAQEIIVKQEEIRLLSIHTDEIVKQGKYIKEVRIKTHNQASKLEVMFLDFERAKRLKMFWKAFVLWIKHFKEKKRLQSLLDELSESISQQERHIDYLKNIFPELRE